MNRYHTQLIVSSHEMIEGFPLHGPGFQIAVEPYPFRKLRFNPDALARRSLTVLSAPHPDIADDELLGYAQQLVIYARSLRRALNVGFLLYAAETLLDSSIPMHWFTGFHPPEIIPDDRREIEVLDPDDQKHIKQVTGSFREGGQTLDVGRLAVRLARRAPLHYAAMLYLFSCHAVNVEAMDLHPHSGVGRFHTTPFPIDHVWFGHAIFAAYAVCQQLDLTVKGVSPTRPSISRRVWDPHIRKDLEERLLKHRIDSGRTILWKVRGPDTRLERKRRNRSGSGSRAQWAYAHVRDEFIPVIDAINHVAWMRSYLVAHKPGKAVASLTKLDVANAQHLARVLLLSTTGFWKGKT